MCDFKPGDEVVCVDNSRFDGETSNLVVGSIYVVEAVLPPLGGRSGYTGGVAPAGVRLAGVVSQKSWRNTFDCRRFRKVERKNDSLSIEAFLTIKPGFEEPRRAPAKRRERV